MLFLSDKYKKISERLKLDKPLVVFDLETTGLSIVTDKIVSLGYIKVWPDGRTKKEEIVFNPGQQISSEASAIHGIKNEDVLDKPGFAEHARRLYDEFIDSYYCGHNILGFDLPLLRREFIRAQLDFTYDLNHVIDTRVIFQCLVPRTLGATYEYYCHETVEGAHNSLVDAEAAAAILEKMLGRHKEIRDLQFIAKIHSHLRDDMYIDNARKFVWKNGQAFFAFSKYRDRSLSEIVNEDPGFLKWILEADFSDETKEIVRSALDGKAGKPAPDAPGPV